MVESVSPTRVYYIWDFGKFTSCIKDYQIDS